MSIVASAEERRLKYDEKNHRWKQRPVIDPCWRGDYREWHIDPGTPAVNDASAIIVAKAPEPTGESEQNQLWCRYWGPRVAPRPFFINPNGYTCYLCKMHLRPEIERWRFHVMPAAMKIGQKAAADKLVWGVERGKLTEEEANQLADEFLPKV